MKSLKSVFTLPGNKIVITLKILFMFSFLATLSAALLMSIPQTEVFAMPESKPAYGDYDLAFATSDFPAGINACPNPPVFRAGYKIFSYLPVNRAAAGIQGEHVKVEWYWRNDAPLRPTDEPFYTEDLGFQNDATQYSTFSYAFSEADAGKKVGVYMYTAICGVDWHSNECEQVRKVASGEFWLIAHNATRPIDGSCPPLKALHRDNIVGTWRSDSGYTMVIEKFDGYQDGKKYQFLASNDQEPCKYYPNILFSVDYVTSNGLNEYIGKHVYRDYKCDFTWSEEGVTRIELVDPRTLYLQWDKDGSWTSYEKIN